MEGYILLVIVCTLIGWIIGMTARADAPCNDEGAIEDELRHERRAAGCLAVLTFIAIAVILLLLTGHT
jgi:hypothetical protein